MATPTTMPAITHVAVTVTDLARSEAWYTNVLGAPPVLDETSLEQVLTGSLPTSVRVLAEAPDAWQNR